MALRNSSLESIAENRIDYAEMATNPVHIPQTTTCRPRNQPPATCPRGPIHLAEPMEPIKSHRMSLQLKANPAIARSRGELMEQEYARIAPEAKHAALGDAFHMGDLAELQT
jgi:hypothetical protein